MTYDIPQGAIDWLRAGERGISSETIFSHLTGIPLEQRMSPPYDSGDFDRCRGLLTCCPEFAARLGEMRTLSPQWARLVERWDEIAELIDVNARAAAYDVISECIHGKRQKARTP